MPKFWTVPWVAVDDAILACAYYAGVVVVIANLISSLIHCDGILEYDELTGITRPRLKIEKDFSFPTPESQPYCSIHEKVKCHARDPDDISEVNTDQVFVATTVRSVWQMCDLIEDECLSAYTKFHSVNSYNLGVENFTLILNANVEATEFYRDSCGLYSSAHHHYHSTSFCPYAGSHIFMNGRLLGIDGNVIKHIPQGDEDAFPLSVWLEAAGLDLDCIADKVGKRPAKKGKDSFRYKGAVLLVSIRYTNLENLTFIDAFLSHFWASFTPNMTYEIRVQRLAYADYKTRHMISHQKFFTNGTQIRNLHVHKGLMFKFVQSGTVGRWSWNILMQFLVLKMGLLAVVQAVLDLSWQYILPYFGFNDWNKHVFSMISANEVEDKKKSSIIQTCATTTTITTTTITTTTITTTTITTTTIITTTITTTTITTTTISSTNITEMETIITTTTTSSTSSGTIASTLSPTPIITTIKNISTSSNPTTPILKKNQ